MFAVCIDTYQACIVKLILAKERPLTYNRNRCGSQLLRPCVSQRCQTLQGDDNTQRTARHNSKKTTNTSNMRERREAQTCATARKHETCAKNTQHINTLESCANMSAHEMRLTPWFLTPCPAPLSRTPSPAQQVIELTVTDSSLPRHRSQKNCCILLLL